ncbi:MAG: hypothetical protein JWR05_383 [Mucilaginibacter sp.]|nr:hypothetical protein [Mucilaginibacter sp.]
MRLIKTMMTYCAIVTIFAAAGCKKVTYQSRDTSSIVAPPEVPVIVEPVDPTLVVFDNVDSNTGWETVGSPVIEKLAPKEGTGYLKNTIASGSDFMQFIKKSAIKVDSKLTTANGQFSFWWYVSDVSLLKEDGQIEITSSGDADKEEYGWSVAKLLPTLKNGWNQINLNFRDADLSGTPNPAALNFFRIFFFTKDKVHADLISGVDNLVFRAIPPSQPISLDNADLADGWQTVGTPVIEKLAPKQGAGYLKNTIASGGDFMQFIKDLATPVNVTFAEANTQFKFWWYVSDVSVLKADGSIEITSSGKSDDHESAWDVAPLLPNLKNGWNEITLDLSNAIKTPDGGANMKAINHFRLFFFTKSKDHPDVIVGVDDLRFAEK